MTISSVGSTSNQIAQQLLNMRAQFDDLQRQLDLKSVESARNN